MFKVFNLCLCCHFLRDQCTRRSLADSCNFTYTFTNRFILPAVICQCTSAIAVTVVIKVYTFLYWCKCEQEDIQWWLLLKQRNISLKQKPMHVAGAHSYPFSFCYEHAFVTDCHCGWRVNGPQIVGIYSCIYVCQFIVFLVCLVASVIVCWEKKRFTLINHWAELYALLGINWNVSNTVNRSTVDWYLTCTIIYKSWGTKLIALGSYSDIKPMNCHWIV